MIEIIATTKNKKYKYIKSLKQKKIRQAEGVFAVEGKKSVNDAVNANSDIVFMAVSESYYTENGIYDICDCIVVRDELFIGLCDTKTPQGIIAVVKMNEDTNLELNTDSLYVYCDNVQDPGNLGTIIRTADAAGFAGVLLSPSCTDVYNPKTVRSSMGSFFNINVADNITYDKLFSFRDKGFNLVCGALTDDAKDYRASDFTKPTIIVVGNEANGVSNDILEKCAHIIIPIYGNAESLNVAVAASILMYEASNQRRDSFE